jgi:hypothetical protein
VTADRRYDPRLPTLVAAGVVSVVLGAGVGPAAARVEPRELLPAPTMRSYPCR